MGNMLGNGREINASWILTEEKQPFLYYSPKVWNSHAQLLGNMELLNMCLYVFVCLFASSMNELMFLCVYLLVP